MTALTDEQKKIKKERDDFEAKKKKDLAEIEEKKKKAETDLNERMAKAKEEADKKLEEAEKLVEYAKHKLVEANAIAEGKDKDLSDFAPQTKNKSDMRFFDETEVESKMYVIKGVSNRDYCLPTRYSGEGKEIVGVYVSFRGHTCQTKRKGEQEFIEQLPDFKNKKILENVGKKESVPKTTEYVEGPTTKTSDI